MAKEKSVTTPLDKLIGNNLRKFCEEKNISDEQLILNIGFSEDQLKSLRSGRRAWNTRWLDKISTYLNIHPSELLGGAPLSQTDDRIKELKQEQINILREIEALEKKS